MRWYVALAAVLMACGGSDKDEDSTPAPEAYEEDPDVRNYVPPGYDPDPTTVVFFGDSITAGFGITNPENSYASLVVKNNAAKWPDHEGEDLTTRFGKPTVFDVSRSGAVTADLSLDQIPRLKTELGGPVNGQAIVMVTIGGNDMLALLQSILFSAEKDTLANNTIDEVKANIQPLIDFTKDPEWFPDGALLYMANLYEATDNNGTTANCYLGADLTDVLPYLDDANDEVKQLGRDQDFAVVDMRGHFLGHGFNYSDDLLASYHEDDATLWFQEDCIHPNIRGQHELRRLFLAAIDGGPLAIR